MSKSTKIASNSRNVRAVPKVEDKNKSRLQKPSRPITISKPLKTNEKQNTKDEEKTNLLKPAKPAIKTDANQEKIIRSENRIKPVALRPKPEIRNQPLRAKHTPEIVRNVAAAKDHPIPKRNVMNSIHNVTVSSPPPKRKEVQPEVAQTSEKAKQMRIIRERTRTRTLEPDEVVVLKNVKSGPKSLDTFLAEKEPKIPNVNDLPQNEPSELSVKEPVAFEIKFEDKQKEKSKPREEARTSSKPQRDSEGSEEGDYEDDFESYESDFETGSSSAETSDTPAATDGNSSKATSETESSDESEETQPPITVIHRDKEDERKLDSGNYDLNSRKEKLQQVQLQQMDSMDTLTLNSDQLDSGISYSGHSSHSGRSSAGFASFTKPKKISKRGRELMQKIQLDTVEYILFDLKPVKYEYYMKIYGNFNCTQATTQTNEDRMDADCQTEEFQYRSIWTQHPPQYDLKFVQKNNNFVNLRNACGEFEDEDDILESSKGTIDPLVQSLRELNKFRKAELKRSLEAQKHINFDRLNDFLGRSVPAVMGVLSRTTKSKRLKSGRLSISNGFYNLNTNFLNALKVVRIFSNSKYNLVLAVHESIDEIYKSDFLNLISVWSTNEPENPIRLLSTWSEVCRVDICSESSDLIVCGLRDGSIALWDLRETYSFCSKLDGFLKHFAATQSIAPTLSGEDMVLTDLGAVVDIKSFKTEPKMFSFKTYKPIQFVSLNDTGILTVWTLIETGKNNFNPTGSNTKDFRIDCSSPWARVKLIQSAICDLREYLELKHIRRRDKFEKTRSYFENDIFNDDVLKELQETQQDGKLGLQGLRFTSLDTGAERIFVATNRNFIISCSKTLKSNRFGKMFIDESKFLFPTAMKLFPSEEFLLVGLSNGSVIVLNCNQNKPKEPSEAVSLDDHKPSSSSNSPDFDLESGKSCAIQNIIRNERKSLDHYEHPGIYDSTKDPTIDTSIQGGLDEFEFRIFDQQVLLSGSVLRKCLVQSIEISYDGRKLYALTDGTIRVYDMLLGTEINNSMNTSAQGFGLVKENTGQQNLVLFTKDTEVQVHSLK